MALDTKLLLTTQFQLPFKICTMGIMTGNTGRHLIVSWINYVFSYRMTKLSLARMTWQTYLITITFQQGNLVITMYRMANITTLSHCFMFIKSIFMSGKCVIMTFPADYCLLLL